jgi:sigma-B regulation protein RsbU (phosphoserine phosphatase)
MLLSDPQFARSDILRIFNRAQIYLFLGAAIMTVGFLSACFSLLRRRFDPLLLWFALFAILYGLRLEMNYQLLWAFGLRPLILRRVALAVGYLVPIPALIFFRILNLLHRTGRILSNVVWPIVLSLSLLTLVAGNRDVFRIINNTVVIAALLVVIVELVRARSASSETTFIGRGLLVFIAGALFDNLTGIMGHYYDIEPFGFVILLACLGIVAGRRTLANEQQLTIVQKELEIARRIQLSILPVQFPTSKSFRVTARYLPMNTVAGDFYDFLLTSDHQAGLLIADVSGHGIPAALIASMVKLAASTLRADAENPSNLLFGMNSALYGNTQKQFVTAGYVYLDALAQELRYSAAAHPPMLLLRNGDVTEISENGLMLAAFDFATYTTLTLPIEAGDRLILYTDGMLEATNIHQEEFGSGRLHDVVRATAGLPHTEAADQIISSIQHWSKMQNDDMTIILCDYKA